jgi:nucleotidyltransferase/DNA polymerase involved in DNA repair
VNRQTLHRFDSQADGRVNHQVGCLMVARLPLACEVADRPELWHRPVAVAHPDAPVVWTVSPMAQAEGVQEGQRLSEAVGRCPTLVVLAARPARYEAVDATLLDAVEQVIPGVEPAGLGVAYVDLSGAIRRYGSPERLHAALLACAPRTLRPRLGVGPTKFIALLAASTTHDAVRVVDEGEVDAFLAPVPVDALPVSGEVVRRLRLVDLTTVGELARLPRRALVAQFGAEGDRLGGLLGGMAEPVRPRPRQERLRERLALPEPLASRPAVLAAADHVLQRVLRHPRRGERVIRQVVVRAETEQGQRWQSTVTLREPRRDRDRIWVALAPVIERAALPGPVSELSIELRQLRPAQGWQGELLAATPAEGDRAARRERVEEGLRQLRARYGRCLVGRMAPMESWNRIPERRWALVELD